MRVITFLTLMAALNLQARNYLPLDTQLQSQRAASSQYLETPTIEEIQINGQAVWTRNQLDPAKLSPGIRVRILGKGFGAGPQVDFSKLVIGNIVIMPQTLTMYEGAVNLLQQHFYETPKVIDQWPSEIISWNDSEIQFTVPKTVYEGPLRIQVQKRVSYNKSFIYPGKAHVTWNPLTERIEDNSFSHSVDVVSVLSESRSSDEIPVAIENADFSKMRDLGEAIFWSYDFNIGSVHNLKGMDWKAVLNNKNIDPEKEFGAIPVSSVEVPDVAKKEVNFDPYPIPNPIKPLFSSQKKTGKTTPTGFVGFVAAESIHPVTQMKGSWIGFSCVSCHGQKISYEDATGNHTKLFAGLPNPQWSMKWNALSGMDGVVYGDVDKREIISALPKGTGEHTLIRKDGDSIYANDNLLSPIAIPIITNFTSILRALSRSEMIVGFPGSYVHSEEPDGAIGAMLSTPLQALTTYMATLKENDELLRRLAIYRQLKSENSSDVQIREGQFVAQPLTAYPNIQKRLDQGRIVFENSCGSCHQNNFKTNSDENMIRISEVGTYFSPTLYQRQTQSIRTAILQNLYWSKDRGYLHDGHVKSLEDLVSPDRCRENSELYNRYYTLNPKTFKIKKGNKSQENTLRKYPYFSALAGDNQYLYWDYQKMLKEFGPKEFGTQSVIPLPKTPHPWCVEKYNDIQDLVLYLISL